MTKQATPTVEALQKIVTVVAASPSSDLRARLTSALNALDETRSLARTALPIAEREEEIKRMLVATLDAVKHACLFIDDDGRIGVTEDPTIDSALFERVCDALKAATGGEE